jgi:hypothetical protein
MLLLNMILLIITKVHPILICLMDIGIQVSGFNNKIDNFAKKAKKI